MTNNDFLISLVKAFNAGRGYTKECEIPDNIKNEIEDAYLQDYDILAILENKGIATT